MVLSASYPCYPIKNMFACLIAGSSVNAECQQIQPDQFLFDSPSLLIKGPSQHLALFTTTLPSSAWPSGYSAAIYLQFKDDSSGEWKYLGAIGEGKESAFFKVHVPESISSRLEVLRISLGVSIVPSINLPQNNSLIPLLPSPINPNDSLRLAKKLLENFVNYALSYAQSFTTTSSSTTSNETFIPAKIITEWYNNTVRKAQMDPVGFFNKLMKSED